MSEYTLAPVGSLAFAYDKAQTWANCMNCPFHIIEYKRGKYDAVSDLVNRKALATFYPIP